MRIELTQGQVTEVDEADYETLSKHKWYANWNQSGNKFYASRNIVRDGKSRVVLMHREILGAGDGSYVDHANRDSLDNRRENLRFCSNTQNARNRPAQANNKSGYKGVCYRTSTGRYRASICVNGKQLSLGHYTTAREAAVVYDREASKHFGEFAYLNFTLT